MEGGEYLSSMFFNMWDDVKLFDAASYKANREDGTKPRCYQKLFSGHHVLKYGVFIVCLVAAAASVNP